MIPALDILNLQYSYPDGRIALRGISFSIQEGECVGLIGPNGAGKSTLLLHLNGLLPEVFPDTAAVRVYGVSLSPANVSELRRRVGLLFQDPDDQLFCPTVYEDVAFGPMQLGYSGEQLDTVVAESLRKAGLENVSSRAPHHLSGGERRRVCLAGVLACQPDILVLDEPTSEPRSEGEEGTQSPAPDLARHEGYRHARPRTGRRAVSASHRHRRREDCRRRFHNELAER